MTASLIALGLYFTGYCLLHSLLASRRCKRWCLQHWPALMPAYRGLYNLLAVLLLLPLLWLYLQASGPLLLQWSGWTGWLMNGIAVAALVGFFSTSGDYSMAEFSGSRQWRLRHFGARDPDQQAVLKLGRWHRRVRHPWYFLALVLIWSRPMDAAQLLLSVLATLYFVVGSRLEERKLIAQFGEAYRQYCRQVPGLIPLPGRTISATRAQELEQQANQSDVNGSA
ncbi:methyltransferase family protein [Motiliproteus sp.]|uniref:methyltransferase family protein n=1 Tax=Motiliproteus sp. TaxID=1898955 RepID=UPI003BAAAA09